MLSMASLIASIFLISILVCQVESEPRRRVSKDFDNEGQTQERNGKLFPIFQIVRFPNSPCSGSTRNGTCYTQEDCSAKGGTSEGTCANSFGVCCIFSKTCGQTSSENCTYFVSPRTFTGMRDCKLEICPCGDNICQLRLDFNSFVITGPTTATATVGRYRHGVPTNLAADRAYSLAGTCATDTFSVTNPGGNAPPAICGTNSGEHMFVDAAKCCNDLDFQLFDSANGNTIPTRSFEIKVTQYSCDFNNLAPPGCTQYFYGSNTGQIQTYNFGTDNIHLANQKQNICIRREIDQCRICYVATASTDFGTNGNTPAARDNGVLCCGYARSGANANGYDCVVVEGAETQSNGADAASRRCGGLGLNGGADTTLCSTSTPFGVNFISDAFEADEEADGVSVGFKLAYVMDSTNCISIDDPAP